LANYFKYPTTNYETIELKKKLKHNQSRIKRITKLVKFNLELYKLVKSDEHNLFSDHVGKTCSYSKSILSTVEELIDCKLDLVFECDKIGLEIQRKRQEISDNLYDCSYLGE